MALVELASGGGKARPGEDAERGECGHGGRHEFHQDFPSTMTRPDAFRPVRQAYTATEGSQGRRDHNGASLSVPDTFPAW
jgi:hypothetical protein